MSKAKCDGFVFRADADDCSKCGKPAIEHEGFKYTRFDDKPVLNLPTITDLIAALCAINETMKIMQTIIFDIDAENNAYSQVEEQVISIAQSLVDACRMATMCSVEITNKSS